MPLTVDLPPKFYDDHVARDLPAGVVVKRTARYVRVELDQAAYDDFLDDARHYAGDAMEEFAAESGRGLVASARAAVRHLLAAKPERPACRYYALCDRPADGTTPHPILGPVPTCQRCADKHDLTLTPLPKES